MEKFDTIVQGIKDVIEKSKDKTGLRMPTPEWVIEALEQLILDNE